MAELTAPCPDPKPKATSLDLLARRAASVLAAQGVNWGPIAAANDLDLDGEPVVGARIPTSREHAFLADATRASGDPLFLWRLGDVSLKNLGLIGYATLNAPTVGDALATFTALHPALCEAVSLRTVFDGDTVSLVCVNADARPNSLFSLRCGLQLLSELIGPACVPTRVGLAVTDPCDSHVVASQIHAPLSADTPFSFITFPARHLCAKVAGADERLADLLRPYHQQQVKSAAGRRAVLHSRLEAAVAQNLPQGRPSRERLAATLGITRSRLSAQLAVVGGARVLIDEVRRKLAQRLAHRPDLTTAKVAALLGFAEPAALDHAYRRWTGRRFTAERRVTAGSSGNSSEFRKDGTGPAALAAST